MFNFFKTSFFFKFFTLLIILALFFFAFSYFEKKQAEQQFNILITQFLQANPEIKTMTYADLNTNLLWALEGKYEITSLIITAKDPIYNLQIGRIDLEKTKFKTIKISQGHTTQLQSATISLSDIFIPNLNQFAPGLPSNFDLFLNMDLQYLNHPETQTQTLHINIAIYQELTQLQERIYGYTSSSTNPQDTILLPLDADQLKLKSNYFLKKFNLDHPNQVKIINNPKLNQSYLIKINPNQNIIHKIYKQTLEKELQNLNQLDKNLKIIQNSPGYQSALAYLQGA